jgi:hypothetical protein
VNVCVAELPTVTVPNETVLVGVTEKSDLATVAAAEVTHALS